MTNPEAVQILAKLRYDSQLKVFSAGRGAQETKGHAILAVAHENFLHDELVAKSEVAALDLAIEALTR